MVAPVAARPGQTYFVPGVRVMRLGPLTCEPEPGVEIEEIKPDILRVEVTRVNHGAGQYCITLNNWFDTLPEDRRGPTPAGTREIQRGDVPLWPRFKYNDFAVLNFGMRLRIDMRYWPDPEPTLSTTDQMAQRWVPMIAGPISDMRFTFSSAEGALLTVCGEDDLCPLKDKNPGKVDYWARPEREIVDDVLRRRGFPCPVAPPLIPWPTFTEHQGRALAEAHFEGQSYLDYLMHFADRWDFEVFMEFASLDDPGSGTQFHFEPARSRTPPDRTLREVYVLERGRNLVDFAPDLKVVDQWTSVTVTGRNRVQTSPTTVSGTVPNPPPPPPPAPWAGPDPLADELHRDPAADPPQPPLVSGPEWRRRVYGLNPHHVINQRGLDPERAEVMAQAVYRKRAREFLKINGSTIGLPRLRPGRHVEIKGMRPPFDGFYYVERTVHTYGEGGLRTNFLARRPGMPFPPYGES